ncbi:hypothetical protein AB395_00005372 (plasmid) [Sinorhizobium fredii CCBAU 45436]|nr:hypothetical protein AB395_00005372 [Sinorhizobium fredii CCBAU 45436]
MYAADVGFDIHLDGAVDAAGGIARRSAQSKAGGAFRYGFRRACRLNVFGRLRVFL